MDVEMRASDEDRQRVIAALHEHTAAGRLTLDEFSDRVGEVYTARTLTELVAVTRGLPATAPAPKPAAAGDSARHLLVAFAIAIVTLLVLGLLMTLR